MPETIPLVGKGERDARRVASAINEEVGWACAIPEGTDAMANVRITINNVTDEERLLVHRLLRRFNLSV